MLIVNLAALSNAQIRKMIRARCKPFGNVKGISVHRRTPLRSGAFALVDMASVDEVKKVIKGLGDALLGASALIQLSQESRFADDGLAAPDAALAEREAQVAIRSWLDTSARYFREGWRVESSI